MQHPLKTLHLLVGLGMLMLSLGMIGSAAAAQKGYWHFERDDRDHPQLEYRQGSKVLFYLGVGRAIGLWIAYPGPPQPDDKAKITIKTSSKIWTVKGDLTNNHDFNRDDEHATYFLQWDMGLSRPKPEFNNLTRIYNQFIDSLVASKQIVIVTNAGIIRLPMIALKGAREQMRI
jgi:hypothetical protein